MVEDSNRISELIKRDLEKKSGKTAEKQEITFQEYLGLLEDNPEIAQSSRRRMYGMILDEGVVELTAAEREFFGVKKGFNFFEKQLKGVTSQISEIMEFFKAGFFIFSDKV